jgi:hypothetical protein
VGPFLLAVVGRSSLVVGKIKNSGWESWLSPSHDLIGIIGLVEFPHAECAGATPKVFVVVRVAS